jgi:hypothetical protein
LHTIVAVKILCESDYDEAAMALPDTGLHRRHVKKIEAAIEKLGMRVLWVQPDLSVVPWPQQGRVSE